MIKCFKDVQWRKTNKNIVKWWIDFFLLGVIFRLFFAMSLNNSSYIAHQACVKKKWFDICYFSLYIVYVIFVCMDNLSFKQISVEFELAEVREIEVLCVLSAFPRMHTQYLIRLAHSYEHLNVAGIWRQGSHEKEILCRTCARLHTTNLIHCICNAFEE